MDDFLPVALTIAGSDSGGGAGIQADLKTFATFGVFGCSVVTSLTAQNTRFVAAIHDPPPDFIADQFDAVLTDIEIHAAKTGMLSTESTVRVVVDKIKEYEIPNLVVDPVMVASSGDRLLNERAERMVMEELLPLARVVTPNLSEACVLSGMPAIESPDDMKRAASIIAGFGPDAVLIKGGHLSGDDSNEIVDILFDGNEFHEIVAPRVNVLRFHGSGCTLSAAIAAHLARGHTLIDSVRKARKYIQFAITGAIAVGKGGLVLEWRGYRRTN